jgi:hypothetical protein
MILQDDRTAAEIKSHSCLVIGTDNFLSGRVEARGGASYAAWACRPDDLKKVYLWVKTRKDMKRVRVTFGKYHPKGVGHCHIYVVTENHPAAL